MDLPYPRQPTTLQERYTIHSMLTHVIYSLVIIIYQHLIIVLYQFCPLIPFLRPQMKQFLIWMEVSYDRRNVNMFTFHMSGTWELVSIRVGKSIIGCHWVYSVKIGPNSQVEWLDARLVAKVYT